MICEFLRATSSWKISIDLLKQNLNQQTSRGNSVFKIFTPSQTAVSKKNIKIQKMFSVY